MNKNFKFKDLAAPEEKQDWWDRELAEVQDVYRIPGYNCPPSICAGFPRNPRHAVDLGMNVGCFSVYASPFFENVYAYEACSVTHEIAKENLKTHNIKNVKSYNMAAHATSGKELEIYKHSSNLSGDTSLINSDQHTGDALETVTTISLEDIYKHNEIDYIDYLKVDIEGSEYSFLMNKDLSKINFMAMEEHSGYLAPGMLADLHTYLDKFFNLKGWTDNGVIRLYESKTIEFK